MNELGTSVVKHFYEVLQLHTNPTFVEKHSLLRQLDQERTVLHQSVRSDSHINICIIRMKCSDNNHLS